MYFVTACVNDKLMLFGQVMNGIVQPTAAGLMVHRVLADVSRRFAGVDVDCSVVMPNHVHAIISLTSGPAGCGIEPSRLDSGLGTFQSHGPSLPEIVRWFKLASANKYRPAVLRQGWQPYAGQLWQRNYFEHIVRNEESLARIREYIANNPARWHLDLENPDRTGEDESGPWMGSLTDGRRSIG